MKNIIRKLILSISILSCFQIVHAMDFSENDKEKLEFYFLYNYRDMNNEQQWSFSSRTAETNKHAIQTVGMGFKYFPQQKYFFDLSHRTLFFMPEIGSVTNITYDTTDISVLASLDTYLLTVNYCYEVRKNLKLFAGLGETFNKIEFNQANRSAGGPPLDTNFNTWIIRMGGEYKLTKRMSINFIVGYEEAKSMEITYLKSYVFKYNYSSPYFIKPSISFEF